MADQNEKYSPAVRDMIALVEQESDIERIVRTANENLCIGRFTEPRWFYDEMSVPDNQTIVQSNPDAYKNGEAFPVIITHIIASIRAFNAEPIASDERLIQRVGMKLIMHGQEYMAREFTVCPMWLNDTVAAPNSVSKGQAAHRFFQPWLLTARDTMRVQVQLLAATDQGTTRTATVAFAGFGLDSRRPYFKASEVDLSSVAIANLDVSLFRNDGDEPIVMTDMSAHLSAQNNKSDPSGDSSLLRVQVNQVGNGTNSEWFKHASSNAPSTLMLADMLGTMTGRAVVHKLDSPIYWEPGEGLNIQAQAIQQNIGAPVLAVALAGTIAVT